jgi:hypothetical protein
MPLSLRRTRRSLCDETPDTTMLDWLGEGWAALLAIPRIEFWLIAGWLGYLVLLGGWIVLQKREPVATLSWLLGSTSVS